MKRLTAVLACHAMVAAAAIYGALVYRSLPERVPTHWNMRGEADGWSDPLSAVLFGPGLMLGILLLLSLLPKMSPKAYKVETFEPTYNIIMVLVVGLIGALHTMSLNAGLRQSFRGPELLFFAVFVFFAIMGNFLGRVRRNFWVGIRTPWTLANETVWNIVHRRAGQLWVTIGILGSILVIAGAPWWMALGLIVFATVIPAIHSYFVWKHAEGA